MVQKSELTKEIKGYLLMILGCIAYGASTSLFLAKNDIVAGGVTGLSVLFHYLNGKISVGLISIAINVPILIFAIKFQGWRFIVRCLITVASLGLITDLMGYIFTKPITDDGVLASLYGGICQGVGIGLFVRYQFSSGGTELLGRLISRFVKVLSIPVCVGILDAIIVVIGSVVTKNPTNMLHALIVIFLSTKISEMILVGFEKSKLCIIITDKGEQLSKILIENSPRGVTMWDGKGMYTQKEHNVIVTCVKNHQLSQLKELVKTVDPNAFIIINESAEVRGKGFRSLHNSDDNEN